MYVYVCECVCLFNIYLTVIYTLDMLERSKNPTYFHQVVNDLSFFHSCICTEWHYCSNALIHACWLKKIYENKTLGSIL